MVRVVAVEIGSHEIEGIEALASLHNIMHTHLSSILDTSGRGYSPLLP